MWWIIRCLSLLLATPLLADETLHQTLRELERAVNIPVRDAVLGTVDYDFAYVAGPNERIILLEGYPDSLEGDPDSLMALLESLPLDLQQANVDSLKATLSLPAGLDTLSLLLGVYPSGPDVLDTGARPTLAESELSMMDRRQQRWLLEALKDYWPTGSVLFLTTPDMEPTGSVAAVPIHWSFRRPTRPPQEPEVLAYGQHTLTFQNVAGDWKASHIEDLIADIRMALIP